MMLPATVAGWAGLIFAVLGIASILLGVIIRLARQHIKSSIDKTLTVVLTEAVTVGMAPMAVRLDAVHTQLVTQDGELSRVLERTRSIENTIDNGLCDRQKRIEDKMDRLFEHLLWDGEERRDT